MKLLREVGFVTSNNWLDFGGEPDRNGIQEFYMEFLQLQDCTNFADNSRSCGQILMNSYSSAVDVSIAAIHSILLLIRQ